MTNKEEIEKVKAMAKAVAIAKTVFGVEANLFAVREINDYLKESEEEDFAPDLKHAYDHAKVVFDVAAPTPDQTFWVFEELFLGDEE